MAALAVSTLLCRNTCLTSTLIRTMWANKLKRCLRYMINFRTFGKTWPSSKREAFSKSVTWSHSSGYESIKMIL